MSARAEDASHQDAETADAQAGEPGADPLAGGATGEPGPLQSLLAIAALAARDPQVDAAKLASLLDLCRTLESEAGLRAFNEAMIAVQTELKPIATDALNPQTKSNYASYAALDRALRPIYTAHGFALSFDTGDAPAAEAVRVLCHVSHRAGHVRVYRADLPADGKGAKGGGAMSRTHAVGSALTYGMRYLLKMIFNVAIGEDDDDGNAAGAGAITAEQAKTLRAAIDEVGGSPVSFCRQYRISKLADLPAHKYRDALDRLAKGRVG